MTQVVEPVRHDVQTDAATGPPPRARRGRTTFAIAAAAVAVLVAALHPALRAGFWSWDWYWIDQHALGNTAWGGPSAADPGVGVVGWPIRALARPDGHAAGDRHEARHRRLHGPQWMKRFMVGAGEADDQGRGNVRGSALCGSRIRLGARHA